MVSWYIVKKVNETIREINEIKDRINGIETIDENSGLVRYNAVQVLDKAARLLNKAVEDDIDEQQIEAAIANVQGRLTGFYSKVFSLMTGTLPEEDPLSDEPKEIPEVPEQAQQADTPEQSGPETEEVSEEEQEEVKEPLFDEVQDDQKPSEGITAPEGSADKELEPEKQTVDEKEERISEISRQALSVLEVWLTPKDEKK